MTEVASRPLRVFLCHSSGDKPIVRELYQKMNAEGLIDAWLDEEKLLPGMDWNLEIEKAVEAADVIIVCLSSNSVTKEGYVQRELRYALDLALEKPEGTIFVIPLRLDDCEPPLRLRNWQYADYFPENLRPKAYQRVLESLKARANHLNLSINLLESAVVPPQSTSSLPTSPISEISATFPSESQKSRKSIPQLGAVLRRIPIWNYGRLVVLLVLLGILGSGLINNIFEIISTLNLSRLDSPALSIGILLLPVLPLAVVSLFFVTLVRILPWRFSTNTLIVRLERLAAGVAAISVYAWIYYIPSESEGLGGYRELALVIASVYLANINILFELRSTMQNGQKYPWWAWSLIISIIFPWLVFILKFG